MRNFDAKLHRNGENKERTLKEKLDRKHNNEYSIDAERIGNLLDDLKITTL